MNERELVKKIMISYKLSNLQNYMMTEQDVRFIIKIKEFFVSTPDPSMMELTDKIDEILKELKQPA